MDLYNVTITLEQLKAVKSAFGVTVEDNFGDGNYNLEMVFEERIDSFLWWCEINRIETKLV